jgi:hypothetical protein
MSIIDLEKGWAPQTVPALLGNWGLAQELFLLSYKNLSCFVSVVLPVT